MIITSALSFGVPSQLLDEIAYRIEASAETYFSLLSSGWLTFFILVALVLTAGGGICALIRKAWWWALSGAIVCVIMGTSEAMLSLLAIPPIYHNIVGAIGAALFGITFISAGIIASILLVKSKSEF